MQSPALSTMLEQGCFACLSGPREATSPSFEHRLLRCFGALQEPAGTSTSGQSRVTLQSGKEDSTEWTLIENRLAAAAAWGCRDSPFKGTSQARSDVV